MSGEAAFRVHFTNESRDKLESGLRLPSLDTPKPGYATAPAPAPACPTPCIRIRAAQLDYLPPHVLAT